MADQRHSVVFSEQFYYPDGWGGAQIPRDITLHLVQHGWRVDVVCGSDPYAAVTADSIPDPRSAGVRMYKVPRILSGDIHRLKLLRQLWYYACAMPLLLMRAPSVYVAQTNPPLMLPIVALVALLRRAPFVIIAQDIYPEILFASRMLDRKQLSARFLTRVFHWAYRRAATVVSLGPIMTQRLLEKGVARERITEISNWATGDEGIVRGADNRLRTDWGLGGKFVVLYSGNLGIAHDVTTPLQAVAQAIKQVPHLLLLFVGKGSRLQEAKALAKALSIEHAVQFRELVPFDMLPHSLGLADMALVTLQAGFEGLVVPSKLLGYMARAVPTLYVGPESDVNFYLEQSEGGMSVRANDAGALASALVQIATSAEPVEAMGLRAQHYYRDTLSRSAGLQRYEALLARVAEVSARSR